MIRALPVTEANGPAVAYVGTNPAEGLAQLEILKSLGCKPDHKVLEIGCGSLVAGYPIVQYLDAGRYMGIEPNKWLWEASLSIFEVRDGISGKGACFCRTSDFYVGPDGFYDFIISHSVLSHASTAQVGEFLDAVARQLAPGGIAAASLRFAEGNEFGSTGSTNIGADYWQYPGVAWYKRVDVLARAQKAGLEATIDPDLTRLVMTANRSSVHDWITLRKGQEVQE